MELNDQTIARLLAVIDAAPQDTLSVEWQGMVLQVSKGQEVVPQAPMLQAPVAAAAPAVAVTQVAAPAIGVACVSPAMGIGKAIKAGDTLCQIKVVRDLVPVTAPCDGTVDAVLATDGQLAEYGQTLFRIRTP